MYKYHWLMISAFLWVFSYSCGDADTSAEQNSGKPETLVSPGKPQAEIDEEKIQDFFKTHGIDNAMSTETGLYYVIENPGEGEHPTVNSTVIMHYRGMTLDGNVFESSYDSGEPLNYSLSALIAGWRQAVPLLGRGGKATLYIPSGLAYGQRSPGPGIGPNEVLIFDVELLDFQ